jgi:hypothetical protein
MQQASPKHQYVHTQNHITKTRIFLSAALNTSNAEYQQLLAVAVHAVKNYDIPFPRCSFQKWNVCWQESEVTLKDANNQIILYFPNNFWLITSCQYIYITKACPENGNTVILNTYCSHNLQQSLFPVTIPLH